MIISVIVPVYNTAKYIRSCVESILAQTINDFELILVDDGSVDGSEKICDEYSNKYSNVFSLHQNNQGVSSARNLGIENASGDYIVFVDSDDWVEPDYLEILLGNMTQGGLSVCRLEESNKSQEHGRMPTQFLSVTEAQISVFSCNGMQGFPVTKMFDRNLLLRSHVWFDETIGICEDVLFVVQYLKYTYGSIIFTDSALYHYRKMPNGSTNNRYKKGVKLQKKQLTEFYAIDNCKQYLVADWRVEDAWTQRAVKGAVTDIRAMIASGEDYADEYSIRLRYVKKNLRNYITGNIGAKSAKISALLCAISPRLEYIIWKMMNEGLKKYEKSWNNDVVS